MRVAVVAGPYVPVPPVKYGGTEQVVYHLVKGLAEQGHEVILLAPGDSQMDVDCELIPIVEKSIYFPREKTGLPQHQKLIAQIMNETEIKLRGVLDRVEIIHSHGFDLKNFADFPNLTTLHNRFNFDELQHYLDRKELYYASISKNQQDACPDLQYVGVVYNGQDPSVFPIVTEPEDYVCFLGRFDRDKNPHLAIELAITLGIKIKVAGKVDFAGEGYFKEEVEKYFDHPLVEYLGELGSEDKIELVSKAKCNLHPTGFREPFGLTVLEAAYCGTPTLAIARGSMPELIEEGRTGLLVEDFVEGYHHIEQCFAMDRKYIARRARQRFKYSTMARQYVKAYQTVIAAFHKRDEYDRLMAELADGAKQLELLWRDELNVEL